MATKSAPRALLSADDRAALGQAIKDAWDDDQLDRHDWLLDLPRWMRAYQGRVEAKNVPWEGASNLNVPVTPTVIDAMHPRLMAGLLNPEPVVGLKPREPSDRELAERTERFLDWAVREEIDVFLPLDRTLLSMLIQGVAVCKASWDLRTRSLRDTHDFPLTTSVEQAIAAIYQTELAYLEAVTRVTDAHEDQWEAVIKGRKVEVEVESTPTHLRVHTEREEVLRDAPKVEWCAIEDLGIPSDAPTDLNEAHHVIHRYYLSLDQIRRKVRLKIFEELTEEEWKDLEALAATGGPVDETAGPKTERETITGAQETDRQGEPERIELLDGYYPWDVNDDDLEEETLTTICADKPSLVLRVKRLETIFRHGQRPFVAWQLFPVPDSFWALGVPQILDGLQTEFNAMHNQRVDAGTLANTPYGWYVPSAGYAAEKQPLEPGFLHPVDDINAVKMATPANWTAWSEREEVGLWALVERRTKVSDLTLGRIGESQGPSRTATGVQQLSAQQAMGFDILIRRVQHSFRLLLKQILALYRQYLPPGKQVRVLGRFGALEAVVSRQDLQTDFDLVFSGNALSTDRDLERQAFAFLSGQIMQPQVIGMLGQMGVMSPPGVAMWFKHLLKVFDVPDRDRMIQVPETPEILSPDAVVSRLLSGERVLPIPGEDHAGVLRKIESLFQPEMAPGLTPEHWVVLSEQIPLRQAALMQQQMMQQQAMQQQAMMGAMGQGMPPGPMGMRPQGPPSWNGPGPMPMPAGVPNG